MSWHCLWDPPSGSQQQELLMFRAVGLGSNSSEALDFGSVWGKGPCLGHRGKEEHPADGGTPQEVGGQSGTVEPGCPDARQHTGTHLKEVREI